MIDKQAENDVLLGFADPGSVATCFMKSVIEALVYDASKGQETGRRRFVEWYYGTGPYIHDNRSRIARYFLEYTNKQWLWMVDNDIEFPPDALYTLLDAAEEHDCKILGAAYWNQYPGSSRYLSWLVMVPGKGFVAVPEFPEDKTVPAEVNAVGMGCTIIHRDVLQAVADMHPNDPWDTFAADILYRFDDGNMLIARSPDDVKPEHTKNRDLAEDPVRMGEDVTFCMRARRAGFLTYGLPSLEVEHFKPHFMAHGRLDAEAQSETQKEGLAHAAV